MAVNVLFSNKKNQNIYTDRRSERNVKCKKQVNLFMMVDGDKRHYTAIKSTSRLLKSLNATHKGVYHFCMKVNMPTKKEKWLKFDNGQYQLMLPFMLYADFKSILKPVDEWYRDKINTMKAGRKGKASYTEKINTHVPSSVYAAPLIMEMFLIHLKCIEAKTVWKSLRNT